MLGKSDGGVSVMPENIGARIRVARKAKGQSLRQLATELGVSASLLSQVENSKVQPSVATLYALVNALGISLDQVLQGGPPATQEADATLPPATSGVVRRTSPISPDSIVQRGDENPTLDMDNGVRWERLSGSSTTGPEILLVTYRAGASSSIDGRLMRHTGHEYAYLLEGKLTLQVGFDIIDLEAGDSFNFDSTRPHMYINRSESAAQGIWYIEGRHNDLPAAFFAEGSGPGAPWDEPWPGSTAPDPSV
ncbi:helix-turn-helix domain-containing protein [Arthrobacter sp. ZGTC412]|uniref:helix-turn-helix domain-containing protein n=1 Tax=Arthrobacter sp. ZGTC412 TaxID=2058900 RepID=UPI000CE57B3E|nr:helix-turn-helix domain-containing protein [Arthrobacter sp. ZGTC412]